MTSGGSLVKAKAAIRANYSGRTNGAGYVDSHTDNLIPGVRMNQFEEDLRAGDGNELQSKFCALHSSAALAVNCFAPFKDRPQELTPLGNQGASHIQFEKQMPIISGRRPSNLDVWIEGASFAIAVESKFLEYFTPKKPVFADAYQQIKPPASEQSWWSAYEFYNGAEASHLDVAQLIKHYFGLRRFQGRTDSSHRLTLLYVFWEPKNWEDIDVCRQHRSEVARFASMVADSSIAFRWMPYAQLWNDWERQPQLAAHVAHLRARYDLAV